MNFDDDIVWTEGGREGLFRAVDGERGFFGASEAAAAPGGVCGGIGHNRIANCINECMWTRWVLYWEMLRFVILLE